MKENFKKRVIQTCEILVVVMAVIIFSPLIIHELIRNRHDN